MGQVFFKKVFLGNPDSGIDISDKVTYFRFTESTEKDDYLELKAIGADADYLLELNELNNGKPVTFNFGWVGGSSSPTYVANITDVDTDYSTNGVTLSIKCGDKGRSMRKLRSKKIWKKKSTAQIFKEVADAHQLGTVIEVPVGGFVEWASLPQANRSDEEFLQNIVAAEKDGNYICFVAGDMLHLVTRNVDAASTQLINVRSGEREVKRVAFRWRETTAPGASGELGVNLLDIGEGKPKIGKVNPATANNNTIMGDMAMIGADAVATTTNNGKTEIMAVNKSHLDSKGNNVLNKKPDTKQGGKDNAQPVKTSASNEKGITASVEEAVSGLFTGGSEATPAGAMEEKEAANRAGAIHKTAVHKVLNCSLEEYGQPLRRMNTVVTLSGVATRYAGNWLIKSVTHTIDNDYSTTSEMTKNGTKKGGINIGSSANKNIDAADKTTPNDTSSVPMVQIDYSTKTTQVINGKTVEVTPAPKYNPKINNAIGQ